VGSKGKKESLYSLSREFLESEQEDEAYRKAILGESHRSSALMASAFVEHALLDLIMVKLITLSEKDENDLFFGPGSILGTFAARIDIAYAMGLIHDENRSDLNIIRNVRNAFAHSIKDIDFHHPLIKKECRKFRHPIVLARTIVGAVDELKTRYVEACHVLATNFIDRAETIKATR
jgi:hypothetical protein